MLCTSCNASMHPAQVPVGEGTIAYRRCAACAQVVVPAPGADLLLSETALHGARPGRELCPGCRDAYLDLIDLGTEVGAPHRACRACRLLVLATGEDWLQSGLDLETSPLGQFLTGVGLSLRDERRRLKSHMLPEGFRIDNARPTGFKCPCCGRPLTLYRVHDAERTGTADFDICDHCFGIWLDREDLQRRGETDGPHLEVDYESIGPAARTCPKCRDVVLFAMRFKQPDTEVDCCPVCFGTWLDGGELAEFCSLLHGGGHRVIDALVDNAVFRKPVLCNLLRHYSRTLFRLDEKVADQERDLEQAHAIQSRLLFGAQEPRRTHLRRFAPFSVAGFWQPAKTVGGDYFDLLPLTHEGAPHLLLCIADVCGKGLPASLLMANFQALLRSFAPGDPRPEALACTLNRVLCGNTESHKFITAFLGLLHLETGELSFANAGHNPPWHHARADGALTPLKTEDTVLGLLDDWVYKLGRITLAPGDRVLLFTDGVSEAADPDGEDLGDEAVAGYLKALDALPAGEALAEVVRRVQHFCRGAFEDDATMLLVAHEEVAGTT